jgi:hypothetical protein
MMTLEVLILLAIVYQLVEIRRRLDSLLQKGTNKVN